MIKSIENSTFKLWQRMLEKYEKENYTDGSFDLKKSWYFSRIDHKKRNMIGLVAIVFAIIIGIMDGLFINKVWLHSNLYDIEYKNNHKYSNVRELIYVGGEKLIDSDNNNLERWCSLYLDVNTNEILRGGNVENYITAGGCKVGLDKIDILNERNTREGFQKYVLNWTGAIEYKENSVDLPDQSYGISISTQDYNKPIDIVVDNNWNVNKEYKDNEKYLISTLSELADYAINGNILEASGEFTENEYIFSILRNCFGYISDSFYSFVNGKNNFSEIYVHEVKIGDIGTFMDKKKRICMGMCIGFDKKNNPIFTICTNSKKINIKFLKEFTKYKNNKFHNNIDYGFNILVIEKKHIIPIFEKHIFTNYYHTNLPFVDKQTLDNVYKMSKHRINNIEDYNKQVYFKDLYNKNEWEGTNLSDKLYYERIDRIKNREVKAKEKREEYNIDLSTYKNKAIKELNTIYNVKTNEYIENRSYYTDEEKEQFRLIDSQREKLKEENYIKGIEKFKEKIINKKGEIKGKTFEEAKKIFENENSFLSEEGEQILKEYLEEIN